MGLTIISEDKEKIIWSGPYSSFGEFRIELANTVKLKSYKTGIYGKLSTGAPQRGEKVYTQQRAMADIDLKGPGAIEFFLHSDCDGEWSPEECEHILDFFKGVIVSEFFSFSTLRNLLEEFEDFINGLAYCRDRQMKAIFC